MSRRLVTVGDLEQLQGALDAAYGIAPKNMMAEALGNVVSAIQVGGWVGAPKPPLWGGAQARDAHLIG